ncbi:MAG: pyridoxine 5'-phosphate synthase [Deltaproteobacteria bacterium]|nr:MAG: pyridoxine 5'-phosphate synthase [Deltaproteobacteria bacterium]
MRSLTVELDALPSLRDAMGAMDVDLAAAAALAELAGAHAVRLGVNPDLKPVCEEDLRDTRRAARRFELRMPPLESLVRVALDARPDAVLLASDRRDGRSAAGPLDFRTGAAGLTGVMRAFADAGIGVAALVAPTLDAVKTAHASGVSQVELYTGALVDLPPAERSSALKQLGDAARLAAKLQLGLGLAGGLGYRTLPEVIQAAPAAERIAVGRAAVMRAMLVGLDRALRDLRALLA